METSEYRNHNCVTQYSDIDIFVIQKLHCKRQNTTGHQCALACVVKVAFSYFCDVFHPNFP